ncbi:MAG: radical SAM protein [Acidobacteriota bacterium]
MNVLLLSGLGPAFRNQTRVQHTFLELGRTQYTRVFPRGISAGDFVYHRGRRRLRVLRPKRTQPPLLCTATLSGILGREGFDCETFPLEHVWSGEREPSGERVNVVALSTTFICSMGTLARALRWIEQRFTGVPVVLGGQFSNLKAAEILRRFDSVNFVVRGDGEVAFPALLRAIESGSSTDGVPNVVTRVRGTGEVRSGPLVNIDLDRYPRPPFQGEVLEVPYESMRGCPFSCKFCSYPAASPQWRWKAARTIVADWQAYAVDNHAERICAMDSTFTVPPRRFRELLDTLRSSEMAWTAYARADDVETEEEVQRLVQAKCAGLSIGFESMSDRTLTRMNKRTEAHHNRTAARLLGEAELDLRASFIIGYPGEDAQDYEQTHRYLVEDFRGRFLLNTFSLVDETLPVWQEADLYQLRILDPENPNHSWTHVGMDAPAADALYERTLRAARWDSEHAVLNLWQPQYEEPLIHDRGVAENRRLEKLLERLAFAEADWSDDPSEADSRTRATLASLEALGVTSDPRAGGRE